MYLKTDRILKDHYKNVYKSEMEQTFLLWGGSIDQFEIQCNECDLKFLTDDLLEKHKRQHLNKFAEFDKVNNYLCQLCPDTFLSYSNLKEHTSVVHGVSWGTGQEDKEFACANYALTRSNSKGSLQIISKRFIQTTLKKLRYQYLWGICLVDDDFDSMI